MHDLAELTATWAHGWTVSRGTTRPIAIDGGVRVDIGQPGDKARYILHTYDSRRLTLLGRDLTTEGTEIKAMGSTAGLRAGLPEEWSMYDPCDLMSTTFTRGTAKVPAPYTAQVIADGTVHAGLVLDVDGEIAASARLAPSGRCGVIDKVWTRPPDQRRGLGTAVMTMLSERALDAGLTTGLLSATAEGRALYSALGWVVRSEVAGAFRASR